MVKAIGNLLEMQIAGSIQDYNSGPVFEPLRQHHGCFRNRRNGYLMFASYGYIYPLHAIDQSNQTQRQIRELTAKIEKTKGYWERRFLFLA